MPPGAQEAFNEDYMSSETLLGESKLIGFVPTTNQVKARQFYRDVLGLRLAGESPAALVFDANGTMLRVTTVRDLAAQPFTVLGWQVDSILNIIERLSAAGVTLLRYPGMNEDDPNAIWTSPAGARVAWFQDPDGNVLSVTQF